MPFLKRALRAIVYYKKNTLLLFLIFTILFSLVLSGLCIRNASQEATRRTGLAIGGSVLVQSMGDNAQASALTLESAQKAANHPAVRDYAFVGQVLACAADFRGMGPAFEDITAGDYDLTLKGSNGLHPELRDDCRLIEGGIGETGYAVVNQWLADANGLSIGDTITVAANRAGGSPVELAVTGVYYRNTGYHYGETEQYAENMIFTDLGTLEKLGGGGLLQWAEYTVTDPADIPGFMADMEGMAFPEREGLGFIALDGDYRKVAMSMETLVNVATLIFAAAIVLGVVLLSAMVMLSLSSREYEIGVLLSMGEGRWKVIAQLAVETLLPVLLGVTAGVLASGQTAAVAGDLLGASQKGVEVGVGGPAIGLVYLCGVATALLASCVTAYKVLRFQPKKLLMSIE